MKYGNEFLGFSKSQRNFELNSKCPPCDASAYQYQPIMGWLFLSIIILLLASWLLIRNI